MAVVLAILVTWRTSGKAACQAIAAAWLAAALLSCGIALCQFFGAVGELPLISNARLGEAYGNLRQRNQFASLTSLGLLSVLWRASRRPGRAWVLCVIFLAVGNAASASRTGLLQWLCITGLVFFWARPVRPTLWRLCVAGLAGYLAAALLLPVLLFHFHGVDAPNVLARVTADLGCGSRRVLWSNVLHLIGQRPWFGWGPGELDYAHYATLYPGPRFCDILDNAHNLPLHLAVEFGVPAALLGCLSLAWMAWRARPWADREGTRQLAWGVLAVILIHSMVEYPLWYGPFQLAVLLAIYLLRPPRPAGHQPLLPVAWAVGATALALAGLGAVWWGYFKVSQVYLPPQERLAHMRENPLEQVGQPLLFGAQARFAELSLSSPTRENATRVRALAQQSLHYSPEPQVIEKLIESAALLGDTDEAVWHAQRYRAAFPSEYQAWLAKNAAVKPRPVSDPQ